MRGLLLRAFLKGGLKCAGQEINYCLFYLSMIEVYSFYGVKAYKSGDDKLFPRATVGNREKFFRRKP